MDSKSKITASKLALVAALMLGFGYILVPLYDVFCDITGLRFTSDSAELVPQEIVVDESRLVTVEFDITRNQDMPWDIRPESRRIEVHPGQVYTTSYLAKNPTSAMMVGQAIPSVTPYAANKHLIKTECFCFNSQQIEPGQEVQMPLSFMLNPKLPKDVEVVTLSYTFFDITNTAELNKDKKDQTVFAFN